MNKITFPLGMNERREAMADLHAGLERLLKAKIAKEEIEGQLYGETTVDAVGRFQAKMGLPETGEVDAVTAHMLNHELHGAGHLDGLDSYLLHGQISDKVDNPVAGLLVRAVDMDPSGENPIGEPAMTDEYGRYWIVYYDHQFRIAGHESGNADIVVRAHDPDNPEEPLEESTMRGNVPRNANIDLTVDYKPALKPQQDDDDKFIVKGQVRYPDGQPGANMRVKAFDVRLRSDYLLGQDRAGKDGRYEIAYIRKQFRGAGKTAADLRLRAIDNKGREIAQSDILFGAGEVEEIDLTIGDAAYRGPSEYEQLTALLAPRLRGLNLAELREDDEHQDVTFLSGNTGADPRLVAYLAAANRLSERTTVPAEVFYGLFRHDLPVNLPSLLVQDPAVLSRTLELAVADNIIPEKFGDQIEKLPARFKELVVQEATRPQAAGEPEPVLGKLLNASQVNAAGQKKFLQRYLAHEGPIDKFWDDLRAAPEFVNKADGIQFAFQAGALTGNHLPLVEALQGMRSDPDPKKRIASARDLARFDEAGWRKILAGANGQGGAGAAPDVPGDSEDEKLDNNARILARRVELAFPTAFVAARLQDDNLDGKANLLTFFKDNLDAFDIAGARLETYLQDNPKALDGIAEADKPAVKRQLRAMQRLYRVAPKYTAMSVLLKDGFESAYDITRLGPKLFALKYGGALGANDDPGSAERVYKRAEGIHAMALALLSAHGLDGTRLPMHVLQDEEPQTIDGIPDWPTLFGTLELCECDHCRSVYSPAAYLVDLLHFLGDRRLIDPSSITRDAFGRIDSAVFLPNPDDPGQDLSAGKVLFKRRGDLGGIELTCENTNTPMPYVDLVNEAMEDYVAPPPAFSPFTLNPALVDDLDGRLVSDQLRAAFTAPPLSEHATIEVQQTGKGWRIHDLAFSYTLRKEDNGPLEVTARGRQTSGSPEELAANPQYLNPAAYDKLRQSVYPLSLPFDLWHAQARAYLQHLGLERSQIMETFLPGDRAALLADPAIGRQWLNLTTAEAELINGTTTSQVGAAEPGVWNLWGFAKAGLDANSAIPDPADSAAWINSGNWLDVLTGRVDVFLQQSGLSYKELLALLGSTYVNPVAGDGTRPITIQAHPNQPQDTCETQHLRIAGMDREAALRSMRFIRLWRKLGWTARDLDRALTVLNVTANDALSDTVLTPLSLIQRLAKLLRLPVQKLLPFWGSIDTAHYIDHDADGQPLYPTLYESLFRNKRVLNPPDPAFTEDPAALSGSLSDHTATISAALGTGAADLTLLRSDADVLPPTGGQPDDTLSLSNLSRLYRHATLAKALRLPAGDYLAALKLGGDPFAGPAATMLFVEHVKEGRSGGLPTSEIDYLTRHKILEASRVAPTEAEMAQVLTELRAELQRIAAENTFVDDPNAPGGPTVDLQGDLTREKLALLGWEDGLVDEAVATLGGALTYRAALATLPPGLSLPEDMPQVSHQATAGQLLFTGAVTVAQRDALLALSADATYQAAVGRLFDAPRRFAQRNMRRYTIEQFETPLATLPNINFPVTLEKRIYHDAGAGKLYFAGAMLEDERDALLALSPDTAYQAAVNALFTAPDNPPVEDAFLSHGGAGSDTAALFDNNTAPAERFEHVLRLLMPYLHKLLSERAVTQMLGEALGLETLTAHSLLAQRLEWTAQPGQKLMAAFLDPGFARSNANQAITQASFAEQFEAYLRLHKIALIVERFECTPRQVDWLFTYGAAAGWPDLTSLPITEQPAPTAPLDAWLRLSELFAVAGGLPRGEEMLDKYLEKATAVDTAASPAEKDAAKEVVVDALVRWTEWPESDLEVLLGQKNDHSQQGLLDAVFPDAYAGAHLLSRLIACFATLKRLGLSAAQCRQLVTAAVTPGIAEAIKQAARAKYDEAQWLELARPLRDALREEQRAALVAYLLAHPPENSLYTWRDTNDIYSYFLLDVEMDPCMMTSRIKQAISSAQLFVQRCLMNLEPEVLASAEVDGRWREWAWMKNYRVWEANRKIFLYPENWIEPELRDDKTPFFLDLESELLQNDLTQQTAETAFRGYLDRLDEVARLEIAGMYHERESNAAGQEVVNTLHVFGRTRGIPHIYFYRRRTNGDYWTPWERVDLDIEGDHLIPMAWQGRLYLIWPIFTERKIEPALADANDVPETYWDIHLARSEYKDGQWLPKKITEDDVRATTYRVDKSNLVFKGFSTGDRLDIRIIDTGSRSNVSGSRASRATPTRSSFFSSGFLGSITIGGDGEDGDNRGVSISRIRPQVEDLVSDGELQGDFRPPPVTGFRLSDCNSDFVPIREQRLPTPDFPQGLIPYGQWLREHPDNSPLYLPKTKTDSGKALKKTPGRRFRILYAHQLDGFSGLTTGPWFFNDDAHTYFVTVRQPLSINLWDEVAVDPGRAVAFSLFGPAPGDPFDPNRRPGPVTPVINPGDPLRFAEPVPAAPLTAAVAPSTVPSSSIAAPAAFRPTANVFRNGALSPLVVARGHLATAGMTAVSRIKVLRDYRYRFYTFYHPYLCKFIEGLNRNGVDGLLQRPQQLRSDKGNNVFVETYDPVTGAELLVSADYPVEEVEFALGGAYSQYNWEIFFHAPLLIANSLRQNQRFADAQRWFHTIFDPTDTSGLAAPERYWRTRPFHQKSKEAYRRQQIPFLMRLLAGGGDPDKLTGISDDEKSQVLEEYEDLVKAVKAWRADPFKPHLVARMRTTAYQKTVVMKYIDNLIAWGDQLFRRDTLESLNEATQLYIMAADILGKRPEEIPPRAVPGIHTYNTLQALLGDFSNALVQIEEFVPPAVAAEDMDDETPLPSLPTMLYFCVPKNDNLLAYWDTVADRLFKIRHCMNIEGLVRQLPLFAPPIDPALLVRAAAAGIDLSSVLNEANAPLPHYRFNLLAQKATELCGELKSLSGALLATLEKRDGERLALLRAEHETTLLKLVEQVREEQLEEADQQIAVLQASRDSAVSRYIHYQKLLGEKDAKKPPEGEPVPDQEGSENASTQDESGVKMIKREQTELDEMRSARNYQHIASTFETLAGVIHYVPTYSFSIPWGMEVSFGGEDIGSSLSATASFFRAIANEQSYDASRASKMAQHVMREHEWVLHSNSAAKEIMQIDEQIIAAELRKAIAELELNNHRKQLEQAEKIEETMRDKYTNQELYTWMIGQISTVYFQAYQLAYDVARRAERAFRHELGLQDSSYIQFGYWDSLKKGLLAGDRLHHDLKRMEVAYLNQNKREFEITKHVSLRQLDPAALIQLRETGQCLMAIPEAIFDLDFPGHYMRRIKNVSITIPAVTGPYTGLPCTLSLVRSSVRKTTGILAGSQYARDTQNDDVRFNDMVGAIQSIVTSGGQNDSGLFETNLRDERFLPFEGAGVIGTWRIELPDPAAFPPFDYDTITDVVLHLRYTARDGGASFKSAVNQEIGIAVNELVNTVNRQGLFQFISLKHDFGTAFHKFLNPAGSAGHQATIKLSREYFPFLFQGKSINIKNAQVFVKLRDAALYDDNNPVVLAVSRGGSPDQTGSLVSAGNALGGLAHAAYDQLGGNITGEEVWLFKVSNAAVLGLPAGLRQSVTVDGGNISRLKAEEFEDFGILLRYEIS